MAAEKLPAFSQPSYQITSKGVPIIQNSTVNLTENTASGSYLNATEIQISNLGNSADRSLSYLCRFFDQLYHGGTVYLNHIGILDFNLFSKNPKFYAYHKLMDIENSHIYYGKFELRVLELKHINLVTEAGRSMILKVPIKAFLSQQNTACHIRPLLLSGHGNTI